VLLLDLQLYLLKLKEFMQFVLAVVVLVLQMQQHLFQQVVVLVVIRQVGHLFQTQSQLELVELEQTLPLLEQTEIHHSMEWFLLVVEQAVLLQMLVQQLVQQLQHQQHQLFHIQVRHLQVLELLVMQVVLD
jgi:hypothetical protein